jgi:hypothetical protein
MRLTNKALRHEGVWESGCIHPPFLDLGTRWRLGSASGPGRFTPGTHWIGGWVGPRAGLEDVKTIKFVTTPGLELRSLGRPARSQSLCRLSYDTYVFLLRQIQDAKLNPYFNTGVLYL